MTTNEVHSVAVTEWLLKKEKDTKLEQDGSYLPGTTTIKQKDGSFETQRVE